MSESTSNFIFAGLWIFGLTMCIIGILKAKEDPFSRWALFAAGFGGFMIFPVINVIIGVIVVICLIIEKEQKKQALKRDQEMLESLKASTKLDWATRSTWRI